MTNGQFISLLSTTAASVVLVILAWLNQNQRLSDLREDINRRFVELKGDLKADLNTRFNEVDRRLVLIESDQKRFFEVTGKLDGRIDQLSRN